MPRANRCFLPGYVWHITHRCHKREFLLKYSKDRKRWCRWLFEARNRYGLCILNFVATSNHIHLLVRGTGNGAIARSMQLIAGRTAQEFNQRKGRKGAYWEEGGYAELFSPRQRYGLVDRRGLMQLLNIGTLEQLRTARRNWTDAALDSGASTRDERWSGSIAVGDRRSLKKLGPHWILTVDLPEFAETRGTYVLREDEEPYGSFFGP